MNKSVVLDGVRHVLSTHWELSPGAELRFVQHESDWIGKLTEADHAWTVRVAIQNGRIARSDREFTAEVMDAMLGDPGGGLIGLKRTACGARYVNDVVGNSPVTVMCSRWIAGQNLERWDTAGAVDAMRALVEAQRQLQRSVAFVKAARPIAYTPSAVLERAKCVFSGDAAWNVALERLSARFDGCRLPECVPIHGDLHFENLILVDNGSLAIIDWGAAGVGDPLYDAVAFAASLVRAGYQTAAREALETYFRLVDGSRPSGQYLQDLFCLRKLEIATHLAEVDRDGFAPSLPWVGGRISGIRADLAGGAEVEIGLW